MSDTPTSCLAQMMPSDGRTRSAATPRAARASPVRSQPRYVPSFASSAFVSGWRSSLTAATLPLWISSCPVESGGNERVSAAPRGLQVVLLRVLCLAPRGWCPNTQRGSTLIRSSRGAASS
jgi:hypothetical protein